MSYIDPRELNDLASFAVNGGLGRGVATSDCVAESPDQLMFISGDELVLLRELNEVDLASCEGVVGWVKKGLVAFQRSSETTPKTSLEATRDDLPRTNLIAPSPSPPSTNRLLPVDQPNHLDAPRDSKRVSGPFELDSPQQSPNIDHADSRFSIQQAAAIIEEPTETLRSRPESQIEVAPIRDSVISTASSEMYGGIGGFMMGEAGSEDSHGPASVHASSPVNTSVETPFPAHSDPPSPTVAPLIKTTSPPRSEEDDEEWDIYDQYARESMYAPMKRMSMAAWRASRVPKDTRESMAEYDGLKAARAALEGTKEVQELDPETPKQVTRNPLPSPLGTGRSVATELRLRIQREREAAAKEAEEGSLPPIPARSSSIPKERRSLSPKKSTAEESRESPVMTEPKESPKSDQEVPMDPPPEDTSALESDTSTATVIETPNAPEMVTFTGPSPGDSPTKDQPGLLASPMSLHSPKLDAPVDIVLPENVLLAPRPPRSSSPMISPTSTMPSLPATTPTLVNKLVTPWTDSPASPHSITATRQAVEAAKEGRRPRGLTLVGRIDADLRGARGPVPITFVVGESDDKRNGIGLGLPSGRTSPVTPEQRSRSPLFSAAPPPPPIPDGLENIRQAPSRFPTPQRSLTNPISPELIKTEVDTAAGPRPGFFAARPRSRSFSAAMAKAVGRRKETPPAITTDMLPSIQTVNTPSSPGTSRLKLLGRKSPRASAPNTPITSTSPQTPAVSRDEMPPSGRSSSFSFSSKTSKTPRKASRALPSPVSHKDFEDTVNAGGMDFELVQPKAILSPTSINTLGISSPVSDDGEKATLASASSMNSLSSRATVPDTDEWGFIKDKSVTPEIFQSRSAPVDHRAAETKWLAVIGTAVPPGGPPKRVKRYVMEGGVPSSLRGKVWGWFIGSPPRVFEKEGKRQSVDTQIEGDINRLWFDHSLFYLSSCPGYTDLRSVLRSYLATSNLVYSPSMCHLAGTMLIHSVAEDAFSLLAGLMEGVLKEYFDPSGPGIAVDAGVFDVVLRGSEKELATTFKLVGLKSNEFLERWYKQLFIRCLPWPTALRVIDVVVSEGPRFLLIASLTILTLSRERLLALPKAKTPLLDYLQNLPQDSLLLPENFMKATERVKFKDEDWMRLRQGVERDLATPKGAASPNPA